MRMLEKTDKNIKWSMLQYFNHNEINWQAYELHLIITKILKNKIVITVWLGRPGIFIGKGGRTIDALSEFLTNKFETKVEIKIKEFDIWREARKTNFFKKIKSKIKRIFN